MGLDHIANIAEISAAVLVIASLIYVGRQIKQNTQSMRLETVQAISSEWNRWYDMVAPYAEVVDVYHRGIYDFHTLNKTERVQFILLTTRVFRTLHEQYFQRQEGAMSEAVWVSCLAQFNDALQYPGWQEAWSRCRHWYEEDFQSVVDKCVTETKHVRPLYDTPDR